MHHLHATRRPVDYRRFGTNTLGRRTTELENDFPILNLLIRSSDPVSCTSHACKDDYLSLPLDGTESGA